MIFSVPINPKLSENEFYSFLEFLHKYKHLIYDLYFTSRVAPFSQDAMGDVMADPTPAIEAAMYIQATTGIPISATFNNLNVRPSQQALDVFIHNFEPLYNAGVRSATIPHTHWIATGQIQKAFPELFIKNTILRNVVHANEIANLAKAGFHYVNIDRDLMRDRDQLIKMKKAADRYNVKLALLANEGCIGQCPMMDEHYDYNLSRVNSPQYFNDPISRVSCPKWDVEDPSVMLKTANIPPWKEDWEELLQYVDVFKMHGRESQSRLRETMDIIRRWDNNEEILFDTFNQYLEDTNLGGRPIDGWRKKIKNCKFDCWDCNYCENVYEAKSNETSHPLVLALSKELVDSVNSDYEPKVVGLTSPRVQRLLHELSKHVSNYLEIGAGVGATSTAVAENKDCNVTVVDSWEDDVQPERKDIDLEANSFETFEKNTEGLDITVHYNDMFKVDKSSIQNVDLFFYDAAHDFESTRDAVLYYEECLAETSILIFDDANWVGIVEGANEGMRKAGLEIIYQKKMLNEVENPDMWWNGLYILVVRKTDKIYTNFIG